MQGQFLRYQPCVRTGSDAGSLFRGAGSGGLRASGGSRAAHICLPETFKPSGANGNGRCGTGAAKPSGDAAAQRFRPPRRVALSRWERSRLRTRSYPSGRRVRVEGSFGARKQRHWRAPLAGTEAFGPRTADPARKTDAFGRRKEGRNATEGRTGSSEPDWKTGASGRKPPPKPSGDGGYSRSRPWNPSGRRGRTRWKEGRVLRNPTGKPERPQQRAAIIRKAFGPGEGLSMAGLTAEPSGEAVAVKLRRDGIAPGCSGTERSSDREGKLWPLSAGNRRWPSGVRPYPTDSR